MGVANMGSAAILQQKPPHRIPKIQVRPEQNEYESAIKIINNHQTPSKPASTLDKRASIDPNGKMMTSESPLHQTLTNQKIKQNLHNTSINDHVDEPELEGGSLHLVPCRWSLSGWKYVKVDPNETKFFSNPHRVNGQGIYTGTQSPAVRKKMLNILGGDTVMLEQRKWIGEEMNNDEK